MRRIRPGSTPLLIFLLAGITINLLSLAGSAYSKPLAVYPTPDRSGTLTGCIGTTGNANAASLKLGGRAVPPATLLRISSDGNCDTGESSLKVFGYASTILISAGPDPAANGASLLAALTTLSTSGPSASHPFLLKLEPGIYDLGTTSLQMFPYVDLEGSGEATTRIKGRGFSTSTAGNIVGADNAELRFLTVESLSGNNFTTPIYNPSGVSNFKITNVTAIANPANANATGIFNAYGTSIIHNVTVSSTNSLTGNAYGISNTFSNSLIENARITVRVDNGFAYGFKNIFGGSPQIINTFVDASTTPGGTGMAFGLSSDSASTGMQSLVLKVTSRGSGSAIGLQESNASDTLLGSSIIISSTGGGFGYGVTHDAAGDFTVADSTISVATSSAIYSVGVLSTSLAPTGTTSVRNSIVSAAAFNKPGSSAAALYNSASLNVYNSSLSGSGSNSGYGSYTKAFSATSPGTTLIQNSTVKGSSNAIFIESNSPTTNTVKIGGSQLDNPGNVFIGGGGAGTSWTCVTSYKPDFSPLSIGCT